MDQLLEEHMKNLYGDQSFSDRQQILVKTKRKNLACFLKTN